MQRALRARNCITVASSRQVHSESIAVFVMLASAAHPPSDDQQKEQSHAERRTNPQISNDSQIQPFVNNSCAAIDRVVCGRFARSTEDTLKVKLIDLRCVY